MTKRGVPASGWGGTPLPGWGMGWAALQGRAGADVEERGLVLWTQLLESLNMWHVVRSFSKVPTTLLNKG